MLNLDDIQFIISENERLLARAEKLESGPGGIMEMKQTIADKEKRIEELEADLKTITEKSRLQSVILRQITPENFPDTAFIHALVGEKDSNGMPKYLWVVPCYGVDFSYVYEYTGKTVGPEDRKSTRLNSSHT